MFKVTVPLLGWLSQLCKWWFSNTFILFPVFCRPVRIMSPPNRVGRHIVFALAVCLSQKKSLVSKNQNSWFLLFVYIINRFSHDVAHMASMLFCNLIQVTIGRILKAQVALRGTIIEWVNVRGFTEENPDESRVNSFLFEFSKNYLDVDYGSLLISQFSSGTYMYFLDFLLAECF